MENVKFYRWLIGGYWGKYGYVGWRRITQGEYHCDANYYAKEDYSDRNR